MTHTDLLVRITNNTPYAANEHVSVGRVRVFGTRVWMVYRRDAAEWQRRKRHNLDALVDLDLLDMLMDLPAGLPVPLRSLQSPERQLLSRVPPGALVRGGQSVTRLIVPPVTPLLAIVPDREWDRAAETASRFAVYCARMVLLPQMPQNANMMLSEASLYGIGVAAGDSHQAEVVLEPEPVTDLQPTPAWWAFSEKIYDQLREHP